MTVTVVENTLISKTELFEDKHALLYAATFNIGLIDTPVTINRAYGALVHLPDPVGFKHHSIHHAQSANLALS